jgi:hypothetical protein
VITLTIDNRVRISGEDLKKLDQQTIDQLKKICTHRNPAYRTWESFKRGKPPQEWLVTYKREGGGLSFPRGRLDEIFTVLGKVGYDRTGQTTADIIPQKLIWTGPELWEAQKRLVLSFGQQCKSSSGVGIWRSPPGSGKTIAALKAIQESMVRTLIVVPTDAVFQQWVERTREYLGIEPGIIKGSKRIIRDVTIASQGTLQNCIQDYVDQFGFLLVDEGHKVGSKTYQETIDQSKAAYRLAVTADERRSDGREVLIYDQFGTHVEEVTKEECYEKGTLVQVDVLLVESPFEFPSYVTVPPERKRYWKARGIKEDWQILANHRFEIRNEMEEVMINDWTRNELIVSVTRRYLGQGEHVIALSTRREHCLRLDSLLTQYAPTVRFMGNDENFEESRDRFARGEVKCAVGTYDKIGVGFEACRELGRGVFAMQESLAKKEGRMQFDQFTGRFARASRETNKTRAEVALIWDKKIYGVKPLKLLDSWGYNVRVQTLTGKILSAKEYLRSKDAKDHEKKATASDESDQGDFFKSNTFKR